MILQKIKTIEIPKTSGKKTIAQSKNFYWKDSNFKNWNLDVKGKATKKINGGIYEPKENATFQQMFNELSNDLDSLCLTQEQILENTKTIDNDGYGYFSLFKEKGEYFVAYVYRGSGGLVVYVIRLSYDSVWRAGGRRRVVVPQLKNSVSKTLDALEHAIGIVKKAGYIIYKQI